MKKICTAINENDRIVIDIPDRYTIQYMLVEARTGKKYFLDEIDFSLSVKKYFGCRGKTIRELYAFNDWHNKKLQIEMNRIWRTLNKQYREKMYTQKKYDAIDELWDERCA